MINKLSGSLSRGQKTYLKSDVSRYFCFGLASKIIPLGASLVVVQLMTPEDYGFVAVLATVMVLSASLYNFGSQHLIVRERSFRDGEAYGEIIRSSLFVALFLCVALITICQLFFSEEHFGIVGKRWFLLALTMGVVLALLDLMSKYLLARNAVTAFGVLDFMRASLSSGISLVALIIFVDAPVKARFFGISLGFFMAMILGIYFTRNEFSSLVIPVLRIREILIFGVKTIPQMLSNWSKMGIDKILAANLISLSDIGAYSFATVVCSVVTVFGVSLNNSYTAFSMDAYKNKDLSSLRKKRSNMILVAFVAYILFAAVAVIFNVYVWPDAYRIASTSICILVFSLYLQFVYLLYVKCFVFTKRVIEIGFINMLFCGIYIVLLLWPVTEASIQYLVLCFLFYNALLTATTVARVKRLELEAV